MATTKISELPAATSLADADTLLVVQGGTTKRITKANALGTIASQDADSVDIGGGAIDATTIGASNAAAATFTQINVQTDGATYGNTLSSSGDTSSTLTLHGVLFNLLQAVTGIFSVTIGLVRVSLQTFRISGGTTNVSASTTQTQAAGTAITKYRNVVTTCANDNDAVTLPTAVEGDTVVIMNNTAHTLQVFPAVSDAIGAGSVDASTTISAGAAKTFHAADATTWFVV